MDSPPVARPADCSDEPDMPRSFAPETYICPSSITLRSRIERLIRNGVFVMQRVTDSLVLPGLVRQCGYHGFAVAPSGRGANCRDAKAP